MFLTAAPTEWVTGTGTSTDGTLFTLCTYTPPADCVVNILATTVGKAADGDGLARLRHGAFKVISGTVTEIAAEAFIAGASDADFVATVTGGILDTSAGAIRWRTSSGTSGQTLEWFGDMRIWVSE